MEATQNRPKPVSELLPGNLISDEKAGQLAQAAELAAGEAANREILQSMGQAMGANVTEGVVDLGSEFDSLQNQAFVIASESITKVAKMYAKQFRKGGEESWVGVIGDWISKRGDIDMIKEEWQSLAAMKSIVQLSQAPIDKRAWNATENALFGAIPVAQRAANLSVTKGMSL